MPNRIALDCKAADHQQVRFIGRAVHGVFLGKERSEQ